MNASIASPIFRALSMFLFVLMGSGASAADVEGAKDHPLVGRYEGSSIADYKVHEFDDVALLKAPIDYGALLDRNALEDRSGPEWLTLQGKVTEIRYDIPEHRSSLEVMENFRASLQSNGFEPLFNCVDRACLTGKVRDPYVLGQLIDASNGVSTSYFDHARYLLTRAERQGAPVYVALITGEDKGRTTAFVRIAETKPLETDKVTVVSAGDMKKQIDTNGRVQLYGIRFDFDSATIRPESRPTLAEIAKLLSENPNLRLDVVGHTDGKGTPAYNQALSDHRADSVVSELVKGFAIDGGRLTGIGKGMSEPLAPNDTEEGRAKNRRVELVVR